MGLMCKLREIESFQEARRPAWGCQGRIASTEQLEVIAFNAQMCYYLILSGLMLGKVGNETTLICGVDVPLGDAF
jgi:hypothetical protein